MIAGVLEQSCKQRHTSNPHLLTHLQCSPAMATMSAHIDNIISDPATVHSGSNNGSFVSDSAGSVISRPRRQAVGRARNKKKRNRNNNRKGGGRNIRKSSKRGGASQNKINKASKKCLNTGMNWRSYQSSVVISK